MKIKIKVKIKKNRSCYCEDAKAYIQGQKRRLHMSTTKTHLKSKRNVENNNKE